MTEKKENITINKGWVLCPSNSFPGKFYYFNVKNGEAVWSQNQFDNKLKRKRSFHKMVDKSHRYSETNKLPEGKSHRYPEATTLPDETTITPHYIFTYTKNLDFFLNIPSTHQLHTVSQANFPEYVPNTTPSLPNIVTTIKNDKHSFLSFDGRHKIVKPFVKFETSTPKNLFLECISESQSFFPESLNKKPGLKLERKLPTPKIRFVAQATFPVYVPNTTPSVPNIVTAIKNEDNPFLSFDGRHKMVKPFLKFETSTPKNLFLECISEPQSFFPESLNKKPVLKLEPKLTTPKIPDIFKSNEKPIISLSSKVESTKSSKEVPKIVKNVNILKNLDCTDLRLRLMAKRKFIAATDTAVKRLHEAYRNKHTDARHPVQLSRIQDHSPISYPKRNNLKTDEDIKVPTLPQRTAMVMMLCSIFQEHSNDTKECHSNEFRTLYRLVGLPSRCLWLIIALQHNGAQYVLSAKCEDTTLLHGCSVDSIIVRPKNRQLDNLQQSYRRILHLDRHSDGLSSLQAIRK